MGAIALHGPHPNVGKGGIKTVRSGLYTMASVALYLQTAWKSTTTSLEHAAVSSASNSAAEETSLTILFLT